MKGLLYGLLLGFGALSLTACQDDDDWPIAAIERDEQYAGGRNGTTFDFSENAFGVQVKNLSQEQSRQFVTGNSFFRSNWVTAPASVMSLDGLGPVFNAISCGSCHFKDGRAQPPESPGQTLNGLLFRLSVPGEGAFGEPLPETTYGGQFQDKAILSVPAEGDIVITYEYLTGAYEDGTTYTLQKPIYTFTGLNYGAMHDQVLFSPRIAPQMPGLGLLEQLREEDILAWADETDLDGDGISGRANYVWNHATNSRQLGRFGWKANQPTLHQQTAGAFNGDIGITSSLFPNDHFTAAQRDRFPNLPDGGQPEIDDATLEKVVLYVQALAVPARRGHEDAEVRRGKLLFKEIGCDLCHRASFTTGSGTIAALDNQLIYPYTDLLLHDMGPELADNRPDFLATGSEWRTPPLWGIGMVQVVNGHTRFLHDGRARTLEEAILWHGGEATASQSKFTQLDKPNREALLAFLMSL